MCKSIRGFESLTFLKIQLPHSVIGNTTDFDSVVLGSSPSGVTIFYKEFQVRKDLKKASEFINSAILSMGKVTSSSNVPQGVKERVQKIVEALEIDKEEIVKIKEKYG
jgi:hypothetical protein